MTTKAKTRRLRMPRVRMPQARTGMLQFLIFLVLSAIVIPYGVNFIAGPEGFGDKIVLKARMDDAFGLGSGTGVTLRGVDVGTVRSVELDPAGGAAEIELVVRGDTRIPADSYMQVTMASMAGIQSVDIISPDADAPYLESGDTLAAPADKQPKQMDAIIGDAASVRRSIGSTRTISTSGRAIPNGTPGRPAPLPTSITRSPESSNSPSTALLRMWRSHNRSASRGPSRPRSTPIVASAST